MPETDISSAVASDLTTQITDYSVDSIQIDSPGDQKETYYDNTNWTKWLGYYDTIPELNGVIDAKAIWTIGKGFKANEMTTILLDTINGWGTDTFNNILENCIRTYHIGGDSFCEIIKDENGMIINLKPLNPGAIRIVVNRKGIIIRYEDNTKTEKNKPRKFQPEEIFHLSRNRLANEIHGRSIIIKLERIILMRNEAMEDWKRVLHRNVEPLWIFHMDTDSIPKIKAFQEKMDRARGKGENMYVPKGVIVPEMVAAAGNASLNPLPWIDSLNEYFYEASGVPKIVIGSSRAFTEASAKIAYLAFQQTIEEEQLYIEEEVLSQLNLLIELEFPASLEGDLLSDKAKDTEQGAAQPNETTAGAGQ